MYTRIEPSLSPDLARRGMDGNNAIHSDRRLSSMLRGQLLGLLRLPALVTAAVLLLLVGLLVMVAWRGLVRLEPVNDHLEHLSLLQDVTIAVEQGLTESQSGTQPVSPSDFETLAGSVAKLIALDRHRSAQTPEQLRRAERLLTDDSITPSKRLADALDVLRSVLASEREAQQRLLQDIDNTARFEFELATVLLFAFPLAGLGIAYLLRDRVWRPLGDLALLLNELSVREYRQIPATAIEEASSALEPVYRNYNTLVARLRALEEEHRRREHTLEQEVREATAALLDLNRQLAESERLAAVGTLSAGLAHELRNPLAGVRMACARLRGEMTDPAQIGRLNLVLDEIDRLNQLLNAQLAQARHAPEPASEVVLKDCVESLLSLVSYQVPERVHLDAMVAEDVHCRLPVGQLRQALLNLVLNAAQAIGGESGSIAVAVEKMNGNVAITVSDDGPGFSPEAMAAPARTFVTAREGGTGLGLATVRRFAQDLGGRITLENIAPHGARVTVVIPCEANRV